MQQNLRFIYSVNKVKKWNKNKTELFHWGDTPNVRLSESAELLTDSKQKWADNDINNYATMWYN